MSTDQDNKKNSKKRAAIEWGLLLAIVATLYITGLHTQVIGTLQRGLLATGIIQPTIPEANAALPKASREFYFTDVNSNMSSLKEFDGKVVFMNIWATWCPPCIAEMPSIHSLSKSLEDEPDIEFVLVSMDEDFDKAKAFMEKRGFDLPIYHYRTKAPGTYESTAIPTTYVITKDGRLAMEKRGLAKYDTNSFEEFMRQLAR